MKRFFILFAAMMIGAAVWSQNVFTVVYATSDDGFVNIRQTPSNKGKILGKLWMFSHGLGNGVYRGEKGNWTKVSVGKVTGWCYSKYVGSQNWYDGTGATMLVANSPRTVIYGENFADEEMYFREYLGAKSEFLPTENLDTAHIMVAAGKGYFPMEFHTPPKDAKEIRYIPIIRRGEQIFREYYAFWRADTLKEYVEPFAAMLKEQFPKEAKGADFGDKREKRALHRGGKNNE